MAVQSVPRGVTLNHAAADRFVFEHLSLPFHWRDNNCVTFAAGFVRALTGRDHLETVRSEASPADLRQAVRNVNQKGGLRAAVTQVLGEPRSALLAAYGDVVLISGTEGVGDSIAVCVGSSVLAPGETGVVRLPLDRANLSWKISAGS
jgi:hypothetical protein